MASINAILGGRGVRRAERQRRRPTGGSSVNAILGSRGQPPPPPPRRSVSSITGSRSSSPSSLGRGSYVRTGAAGEFQRMTQPALAISVPEIVPPQFRKAVAIHGQRLNEALEASGSDLTGPEYLAKLIEFESGWDPTAYNPSSASGLGQFIDSTADDFRTRLGVETQDPSKPKQMIKGASLHASGKVGYQPLYAGYNPGYSDTDPIPGVAAGGNVKVKVPRGKLKRQGIDPNAVQGKLTKAPISGGNAQLTSQPFKPQGKGVGNPAKLIDPKWDADDPDPDVLAKGISPVVKKWARKYDVDVSAGYDPEEGEHDSPGHNVTGTATDLVPKNGDWDKLEKGLAVLAKQGFEVGYDGSVPGTLAWSGHGRNNHAHVEWVGQGSDPKAIQRLGNLTEAQVRQMEQGTGGGAIGSGGFLAAAGAATGATSDLGVGRAERAADPGPPSVPAAQVREGLTSTRAATASLANILSGEGEDSELAQILAGRGRFRPRRRRG